MLVRKAITAKVCLQSCRPDLLGLKSQARLEVSVMLLDRFTVNTSIRPLGT